MSLEGRRTRPPCPAAALAASLHLSLVRESHFYRASYAHAYSYGCARRLNYELSSRARGQPRGEPSQIDHARPALLAGRVFGPSPHLLSSFFNFIYFCRSREKDTRFLPDGSARMQTRWIRLPPGPRERTRAIPFR